MIEGCVNFALLRHRPWHVPDQIEGVGVGILETPNPHRSHPLREPNLDGVLGIDGGQEVNEALSTDPLLRDVASQLSLGGLAIQGVCSDKSRAIPDGPLAPAAVKVDTWSQWL